MARALALAARMPAIDSLEVVRATLVYGCALALICAGPAFPNLAL